MIVVQLPYSSMCWLCLLSWTLSRCLMFPYAAIKVTNDQVFRIQNIYGFLSCLFARRRQVVRQSADVLNNLSTLRRDFELKVDKNVVSPLSRLVDDTRTDIEKERRAFKKAMSDVREARDQLDKANAQLHQLVNGTPVTNNTNPALSAMSNNNAQLDVITAANNRCSQAVSVLEDKERELMTSKDKILMNLYSFVGQESNYVSLLVDFFRAQEAYFEESLQILHKAIPELVSVIESNKPLTVFHRHLSDHLAETDRTISYVLETCISRIDNDCALAEEKALNLMEADDELLSRCDPMTIASALKQYLNSLPEPLITFTLAERWADSLKTSGSDYLELIEDGVRQMPTDFRQNLAYLCLFLHKVASHSAVNKMTPDNLSIVLAPNLYRLPTTEPTAPSTNESNGADNLVKSLDFLHMSGPGIKLVNLLITHADTLFADEKVHFSHLKEERSNGVPLQTHSRTPSNASLTEFKPPKPVGPRLYPALPDDPDQTTGDSCRNPTSIGPAIGFVVQDIADIDHGENRLGASQSQAKPNATPPTKPLRKKTIAPRPPFPPPLPPSATPTTILLPPQPDSTSELDNHESSADRRDSTGDQTTPYPIGLTVHPPNPEEFQSKSPIRMDEYDQLKAPPRRPPRPGGTTPK
ncbi:SH3 domain-binding protein 1 [Fasciolopsis buskii]|uniref:SH3 domain-binding protein 1 n=1 Tax=Fasciolopsis buskii TaxID=27845 RepID=A0A8E0S193_9TREM|nr:SH3 domain-binding protein 1 [Fasciolopsis buski]